MVAIKALTPELVQKYRNEIAQFYYDNLRECSFLENYTYDQAYAKIGDFIEHIANDSAIGYGAFDGDSICGYIWAYPHQFREERRMYVNEVHIAEGYRKRGIGKTLLEKVEKKTKEMGINALYIHSEAENRDAIRLYKLLGYSEERVQLRKAVR